MHKLRAEGKERLILVPEIAPTDRIFAFFVTLRFKATFAPALFIAAFGLAPATCLAPRIWLQPHAWMI